MLSLFKATSSGLDWDAYWRLIEHGGPWNGFVFIAFMAFIHLALVNILTAIFVEHALKLAEPEKENKARIQQMQFRSEAEELKLLIKSMDRDQSGTISVEEFKQHMEVPRFRS